MFSLLFIVLSCKEDMQLYKGLTEEIHLGEIQTDVIQDFVPSVFTNKSIGFISINMPNEKRIKSISKVIMKDTLIYLLDFKQNDLLIFNTSGDFLHQINAKTLGLKKIHDFQIDDQRLIVLDAKLDIIKIFNLDDKPKLLDSILPKFEISSFYNLSNGRFLVYTSPWNPNFLDQIQLTDQYLNIQKSYFKREIKEDENYVLSSNDIYPFRGNLYYSHPSFNKLVEFDKLGNLKKIYRFEFNQEVKAKYLTALEKYKEELVKVKFINGYCFITDSLIIGDIANGLNEAKAFYFSRYDSVMHIERRKYSTILSNKVGAMKNGIITAIYPGQYQILKDSPSVPEDVKKHLESGQYVISIVNLN